MANPFGRMLTDKRVDDAEGLAGAGRTQHDGTTEGIDNVDPALVHPSLEIVNHLGRSLFWFSDQPHPLCHDFHHRYNAPASGAGRYLALLQL